MAGKRRIGRHIRRIVMLCAAMAVAGVGCATRDYVSLFTPAPPDIETNGAISSAELETHVAYLAHKSLKGRMPLSMGSAKARAYIVSEFEALGLEPWGDAEGFEQSVKFGTNVVGVLPGSDTAADDEIIVMSAHYDHVGGDHLGACDNASGVAILLECAERLAAQPNRPRRTVAFAAFDSEERGLWGSMAFTCRADFDAEKIGAIVNIDMAGRKFLDVLEDTLFVSGTGLTPGVEAGLKESAAVRQVTLVPVGMRFVGPRSDHAALDTLGIPSLFLSCGVFPGYHSDDDTIDKLDFDDMADTAVIACDAVSRLADESGPLSEFIAPTPLVTAELSSISGVIGTILTKHPDAFTDEQVTAAKRLQGQIAAHRSAGSDDPVTEQAIMLDALHLFLPLASGRIDSDEVDGGEEAESDPKELARKAHQDRKQAIDALMYARYGDFIMGGYRAMVDAVLETPVRSIAWRGIAPDAALSRCYFDNGDMVLTQDGDAWVLDTLFTSVGVNWEVERWLRSGHMSIFAVGIHSHIRGTREDILATLILAWRNFRESRIDTENHRARLALHDVDDAEIDRQVALMTDEDEIRSWDDAMDRVLAAVSGEEPKGACQAWQTWWFDRHGLPNEDAWIHAMVDADHQRNRYMALSAYRWALTAENRETLLAKAADLARDAEEPMENRLEALKNLAEFGDAAAWDALTALRNDDTALEPVGLRTEKVREAFRTAFPDHVLRYSADLEAEEPALWAEETEETEDKDAAAEKEPEIVTLGDCATYLVEQLVPRNKRESDDAYDERLTSAFAAFPATDRVVREHAAVRAEYHPFWSNGIFVDAPW